MEVLHQARALKNNHMYYCKESKVKCKIRKIMKREKSEFEESQSRYWLLSMVAKTLLVTHDFTVLPALTLKQHWHHDFRHGRVGLEVAVPNVKKTLEDVVGSTTTTVLNEEAAEVVEVWRTATGMEKVEEGAGETTKGETNLSTVWKGWSTSPSPSATPAEPLARSWGAGGWHRHYAVDLEADLWECLVTHPGRLPGVGTANPWLEQSVVTLWASLPKGGENDAQNAERQFQGCLWQENQSTRNE